MNLEEYTSIINHRIKALKLGFYDLGRDLALIQEKQLYVGKYNSLKAYVEAEIDTTYDHVIKIIGITKKYSRTVAETVGFTKLLLIAQVPEQKREEMLELVQDTKINRTQLASEVKRLKSYEFNYSSQEENILCLKRQYYKLKTQLEAQTSLKSDLISSLNVWLAEAKKYKNDTEIEKLIKYIEDDLKTLGGDRF